MFFLVYSSRHSHVSLSLSFPSRPSGPAKIWPPETLGGAANRSRSGVSLARREGTTRTTAGVASDHEALSRGDSSGGLPRGARPRPRPRPLRRGAVYATEELGADRGHRSHVGYDGGERGWGHGDEILRGHHRRFAQGGRPPPRLERAGGDAVGPCRQAKCEFTFQVCLFGFLVLLLVF